MGFGDLAKNMLKNVVKNGWANSNDFPKGTILNWNSQDGEYRLVLTLPSHEEYIVSHDKVKYATLLAMGVVDIKEAKTGGIGAPSGPGLVYGAKYKVEFTDGKTAIITADMATMDIVETVLF